MIITVRILGADTIQAKLRSLGTKLQELEPEFIEIGTYLKEFYTTIPFAQQGFPEVQTWQALAPSTIAQKQKNMGSRRGGVSAAAPLIGTGAMKDNFRFTSGPSWVRISNPTDYFKYHQSDQPRKSHLPQRLMMALNLSLESKIRDVISHGIRARIDGA